MFGKKQYTTMIVDKKSSLKHRLKNEYGSHDATSLGTSGLAQAVKLPHGENKNEWLAVHVVDYVNSINMLYGSLSEHCTKETCPKMSAGIHEYLWMDKDSKQYAKPTAVSAPEYVNLLMQSIEDQVSDEAIFPSDPKVPFPSNFSKIVKQIFKRLVRVYAHIYCEHFQQIKTLGEDAHLNTNFKHFCYFVFEFDLVELKELAPVRDVLVKLMPDVPEVNKIPEQ